MYNRPPFNKFGMSPQNIAQALQLRGNASNVLGMAPRAPMMVPPASTQPSAPAGGAIPVEFMNTPDGQTLPNSPQMGLGNQIGMGQQNAMNAFGRTMTPNQPKPQFGLSPQVSNAKMGY